MAIGTGALDFNFNEVYRLLRIELPKDVPSWKAAIYNKVVSLQAK